MIYRRLRPVRPAYVWIAVGLAVAIGWELFVNSFLPPRLQLIVGVLLNALPAAASFVTARRVRGDRRLYMAWLVVGVALACATLGSVVELLGSASSSSTTVAEITYLAYYPIFLAGVLRFPTRRHTGTERARLALDVAVISLCMASVVWQIVLAPTIASSGASSLVDVLAIAYPTGDLLMVFGLVRLLVRGALPSCRGSVQLLGCGMAALIIGDLIFSYGSLHGGTFESSTTTCLYLVGAAFLVAAAVSQSRPDPDIAAVAAWDRVFPQRRIRGALVIPYSTPLILVGLLVHSQFAHDALTRITLSIAAGVAIVLVGARQITVQRDLAARTRELRHQALHDALTGLPNRALILDRVENALTRARRHGTAVGVMFIDLDGFKRINDTYGHAIGDRLLCEVSRRLAAALRQTDTIGRLGGDEFVILVESDSSELGAEAIADRIRGALAEPVLLDGPVDVAVIARASIGIAVGLRANADELLRDADVALYAAKDAGKDRYVLFAHQMQAVVQERLALEMDLRDAIGTEELTLAYQPTINLRTGAVTGTEALLRWQHPTRGLVMPDEFIPLAEETGLILPIGRHVLLQACRQTAIWHRAGHPLSVSVNVSSRQLDNGDLVSDVAAALLETDLPPASLILEITETVLVRDTDASAHRLRLLKELGVRIAIDDFGTGYSSISYLQRFPVDALKIDRAFISAIGTSAEADALVHTLVQLGLALGLETCPEGIENDSQLQALRAENCHTGQGYLFARPLHPDDVEEFLFKAPTPELGWDPLAATRS